MRALHQIVLATIVAIAGLALLTPAFAQRCENPVCRSGETYERSPAGYEPAYGTCNHCNWLGHCSHYIAACPADSTLDVARGVCTLNICSSCGAELPLCDADETYTGSGTSAEGVYGSCGRGPTGIGAYESHQLKYCREGWELQTATGMCRKICAVVGPIVTPIGPGAILRPDLILRRAWLRNSKGAVVKFVKAKEPYYACFEVANIGGAASGLFHVGGGGLGVPTPPEQAHATLAPGASREGCLSYATTPGIGTWRLVLKADSRDAIVETRNDNNERTLSVRVRP
ncbi:MAG: hypothetical protein WD076_08465 [Parvularculaceae bacterium]